jgi:histidinol phosphatase-like enzyme
MQYCPYIKGAVVKKYDKMTKLRKPGNLMILNLMKKWFINKRQSFMIGDQLTDKLAANKSKLFFEYSSNNFYNQVKKIIFQLNKK